MNKRPRINLKHLRYFSEIARRGSVGAAAKALFVAPQTVSAQLLELERSLGHSLFERIGRRLVLTHHGEVALEYATSIFALGDELSAVLSGDSVAKRMGLRVGMTDSVPKLLSVSIIEPVLLKHRDRIELICNEGAFAELLGRLAAHELDAVFADMAVPSNLTRSLHGKLLMNSGMSFMAAPQLAKKLGRNFPKNLHGAPLLYSSGQSATAQALEIWLAQHDLQPTVAGRFNDSALMKGFAHRGLGVVVAPTSIERAVAEQYQLKVLGRSEEVRQPLFLIRPRRERPHPLIAEIEHRYQEK